MFIVLLGIQKNHTTYAFSTHALTMQKDKTNLLEKSNLRIDQDDFKVHRCTSLPL